VPVFVLAHRHRADECRIVFAAWKGFSSPLRGRTAFGSCPTGGHRLWWIVEATDAAAALAQVPPYIASRTEVEAVREVPIP
jgi:hypothetical protein